MAQHNLTLCDNCGGKIVLSLDDHVVVGLLTFCCEECADNFDNPDNGDPDRPFSSGLAFDIGLEEGGY